jgi:hypothetical protein
VRSKYPAGGNLDPSLPLGYIHCGTEHNGMKEIKIRSEVHAPCKCFFDSNPVIDLSRSSRHSNNSPIIRAI